MSQSKYTVFQDREQWLPFLNWFWQENPPVADAHGVRVEPHGAYPARWIAVLSAWWHTR